MIDFSFFKIFGNSCPVYWVPFRDHLEKSGAIYPEAHQIFQDFHRTKFLIAEEHIKTDGNSFHGLKEEQKKEIIDRTWDKLLAGASPEDASRFKNFLNQHFHQVGISSVLAQVICGTLAPLWTEEKLPFFQVKDRRTQLQFVASQNSIQIEEIVELKNVNTLDDPSECATQKSGELWVTGKLVYSLTFRENDSEKTFLPHIVIEQIDVQTNYSAIQEMLDDRTLFRKILEAVMHFFKKITEQLPKFQDGAFLLKEKNLQQSGAPGETRTPGL
jgi:hypothetical protein